MDKRVYNMPVAGNDMKVFRRFGELGKHDIGAVFDNNAGKFIGTAMLCKSPNHTSISMNKIDFRFAALCFQYLYCQNRDNMIAVIPMDEAKELFKKGRDFDEFVVLEWFEIEHPSNVYELPFDK